jgi:hypothetical protein
MGDVVDKLVWKKSSYSANGDCVEVAFAGAYVLVRDTKNRQGAVLRFTVGEWDAFLKEARTGRLDFAARSAE